MEYILASFGTSRCNTALFILDCCYLRILLIIALLTGQRNGCGRTVLCPRKLRVIIMTGCLDYSFLRVGCGCKNLAVLVLQLCCSNCLCNAIFCAGGCLALVLNISLHFCYSLASITGKLSNSRLIILAPNNYAIALIGMTGCRKLYSVCVLVFLAIVSCGSNKYVLTIFGAGRCNTALLVLRNDCVNSLLVVASLTSQVCLCRGTIFCPVELSLVIVTQCLYIHSLGLACGCKNLAVLVLQLCLCGVRYLTTGCAGCVIGLFCYVSLDSLYVLTSFASELCICRLEVLAPLDYALVLVTQCRKLNGLGVLVFLAIVSCGCNEYILASLVAGCCNAVCLILGNDCINVLSIVASLAGQRCLCGGSILCPVELRLVIVTQCRNRLSNDGALNSLNNLAVLVLQLCLCISCGLAVFGAGCRFGLGFYLSRNFFLKIAARAGELTSCCCFVVVPYDGLLVIVTQSSTFLYFSSLCFGQFLTQTGCLCSISNLLIFCAGCILLFRSYFSLYVLLFCAANFALCRNGSGIAAVLKLGPLELRLQGVLALAGLHNVAYGVLVTFSLAGSGIGYLYAAFIGAGAFGLGDFCLCCNRIVQLNRDGIIIDQAVALILFLLTNRGANQRIEGYGIGAVIVLGPLRILCSIGMTGILYNFIVFCLVLIILFLFLFVVTVAAHAVLLRFGRLLYRLAANRADIALASVPFIGLIAVRILLLGEVGFVKVDVMMITSFLLVLNALASDAGHCLGTSQVCNPHELIVVVDFSCVSELLHHRIAVLIVDVAVVVRIVVAFLKFVTIAIVLAVNGIILRIGRLGTVAYIILTGDVRQIGCDGNIQLAIALQADACNRMIAERKVCAICAVYQSERHAAECVGLVALAINGIVLLDSCNFTAGQIIAQDVVRQVEVQLTLILCASDCDRRIDISLFCMLCIQLGQHIIGFHLLGFRIVNLNNRIILVGIRLVGEINQGIIIGIAIAGVRIGNRMADQLILRIFLRVHLIHLGIIEPLNQVGRIIYIVHVRAIRADIALCTSKPSVLIGLVGSYILISRIQFLEVAIVQISCGRIAEHEVHMVYVTIGLHAVARHNFTVAVGVARVNIIPLAIYLDCIPEMVGVEVRLRLTIHGNISLERNTNQVYTVVAIGVHLLAVRAEGVQILGFLPVVRLGHIGRSVVLAVDFRMHALNQICIGLGVTQANGFAKCQRTKLVAFPVVDNCRSQLLCCLFGINRNGIISGCFIYAVLIQVSNLIGCHGILGHLLKGYFISIAFNIYAVFFRVFKRCFYAINHGLCIFFKVFLDEAFWILGNVFLIVLHIGICLLICSSLLFSCCIFFSLT